MFERGAQVHWGAAVGEQRRTFQARLRPATPAPLRPSDAAAGARNRRPPSAASLSFATLVPELKRRSYASLGDKGSSVTEMHLRVARASIGRQT